jgi:RNA polymerase sigma-B factor
VTDTPERIALFETYGATGSTDARDAIVESFLPLASYFANRYRNRGAEQDDLTQVAHLALVKAVERFDVDHGVQFSTFAGRTIDGELKRYFRDRTWSVRVPRSLQERALEVRRTIDELSNTLGRSPRVAEVAEHVGCSEEDVLEALDAYAAYRSDSLDRPGLASDNAPTVGDSIGAADPEFEQVEIGMVLTTVLDELPEREREIVTLRFYDRLSQREIAEKVGISQMHVSRLLRQTLDSLRTRLS